MNLTEPVHAQGTHVTTAYRWYREGTLPVPAWDRALNAVGCARRDLGLQLVLKTWSVSCRGVR